MKPTAKTNDEAGTRHRKARMTPENSLVADRHETRHEIAMKTTRLKTVNRLMTVCISFQHFK